MKESKIYIVGEDRIEAASAADLVKKMSALSFAPAKTTQAWMEDAAERYRQLSSADIRTDSAEHFVADLTAVGAVVEEAA